ncbi:hypothetical protein Tco_0075820 [Tanacetum coccineum]
MTTLAENMIIAGADNRPPMLEKQCTTLGRIGMVSLDRRLMKNSHIKKSFKMIVTLDVTPRQGGNARRKQEWILSQHTVSL